MQTTAPARNWEVLIIGGASGSGKSSISYRLAHYFGVGICEVDDIHRALMRMTTPEQQPTLHFWDTRPENYHMTAEDIVALHLSVCHELAPAFEAVIANHLEGGIPLILEGDYLLPALAALAEYDGFSNNGRVRGLFVHEDDEEQFVLNFLQREPFDGRQETRARVSWLLSRWFAQHAHQAGCLVVAARPWQNNFERILALLQGE